MSASIPRLQNGDELTRDEFERRYKAMPGVKAELIEGVVYMPSPIRFGHHSRPHSHLHAVLVNYEARTPGVAAAITPSVRLDNLNEPEPDLALVILPDHGGQVQITDDYLDGPPDLLAEVSASTVSIDLHRKLRAYQRNGVKEYIVLRTEDGETDWFVHDGSEFQQAMPEADGVLRSQAFPGLWIDVPALCRKDLSQLLATLNCGLAAPEHAAFVASLHEAAERIRAR